MFCNCVRNSMLPYNFKIHLIGQPVQWACISVLLSKSNCSERFGSCHNAAYCQASQYYSLVENILCIYQGRVSAFQLITSKAGRFIKFKAGLVYIAKQILGQLQIHSETLPQTKEQSQAWWFISAIPGLWG